MIHSLMSPLTPSQHAAGDHDARNGFFVEMRRVRRTLNAESCSDPGIRLRRMRNKALRGNEQPLV